MQEKLKEIINSYPEFSRETVYNIVSEFNVKTLEEKRNQNREKILESFGFSENEKIYLFEKTVRKCKMLIISQKENNVLVRYREIFGEERNAEWNFSKLLDDFENESKWDFVIDIELSEKIEEINLSFEFYRHFYIRKDFLEYFLFKNIMLFLSEESLVALDFMKALKEVEKYDVVMELPEIYLQNKDFFNYGTMFSMLNEKTEIKKGGKYKKLPLSFLMVAMFCNNPQGMEFIFDDIIKHKEIYLNIYPISSFRLFSWREFVILFLKVNKITDRWNIELEKYFDENETKEKVDIIYDIFDIGEELEEKNFVRKLVNKKSFEAVEKMKEQLSQKLLAQKMKTVKQEKFEISKEFKELEKMLKKQFPSIELINEEQRLFLEGFEQKNCAYSYMEKIKDNKEIIFSLKIEKEGGNNSSKISYDRYTIGIEKVEDYHFEVTDVRKKSNISDEDTKTVFEKITEIVRELNKKKREKERIKFEQEIINNLEEENNINENNINFDIPEWFELYIERYCGSHIVVKNSRTLFLVSKKFNNDSYKKFKNGKLRNKVCSFGRNNFFEFSYNENGITDIAYTNIGDEPSSLKKENPELLKEVQTFYEEIIKEIKEKENQNKN